MSHHPYPRRERALHQLNRQNNEARSPLPRGYTAMTAAVAFERWAKAMRAAVPTAQQLTAAWTAALKPRPASSEEKST